jgi:hypothetical protein
LPQVPAQPKASDPFQIQIPGLHQVSSFLKGTKDRGIAESSNERSQETGVFGFKPPIPVGEGISAASDIASNLASNPTDLLQQPQNAFKQIKKFSSAAELDQLPPIQQKSPFDLLKRISSFDHFVPRGLSNPSDFLYNFSTVMNDTSNTPGWNLFGEQRDLIGKHDKILKDNFGDGESLQMPMDVPIFSLNPRSPLATLNKDVVELGDPWSKFDFGPSRLKPKGRNGKKNKRGKKHRKVRVRGMGGFEERNATFGEDSGNKRKIHRIIYGADGARNVSVIVQKKNSSDAILVDSYYKKANDTTITAFKAFFTF